VLTTGFVYALRNGDGDHVKIGKTRNLKQRAKSLQVGHHKPLVFADCIEHEDYEEGEKHIHKLLKSRRVRQPGRGPREHFLVNDAELAEAFAKTRTYLDVELPRERQVEKYEVLQAGKDILPATDEDLRVKDRVRELRVARAHLNRQLGELDAEEKRLMTSVKLAIGPAGGIDGVASWESVAGRRRFDEESLKANDPEVFEAYLTAFDKSRFKQEQPGLHESYMRVTTHREFLWVDDDNPGSDTDAPGGSLATSSHTHNAQANPQTAAALT
jgi:hypothetical protein